MNARRLSNLFSFISIGLIAVSLIVKYLLINALNVSADVTIWFDRIAYYLVVLATLISAFLYAKSRRNGVYMTLFIIFLIVIIVFTFVI